jgi:hypothetical protein
VLNDIVWVFDIQGLNNSHVKRGNSMKNAIILLIILMLTACSPSEAQITTSVINTSVSTNTPIPTQMAISTLTPTLTATPMPTQTTTSTLTPTLTATPDLTTLGDPATPIPYKGDYPQNKLEYDENDFSIFQRVIHDRPVTIAWEKELNASEDVYNALSDIHFEAFITWWEVFGGFPYESYTLDVRSFSRRFLKFATPICTGFQVLNRHIWVSRELPWRPGPGAKRRVARNRAKWPGYPHMWGAISETRSKISERRVYSCILCRSRFSLYRCKRNWL